MRFFLSIINSRSNSVVLCVTLFWLLCTASVANAGKVQEEQLKAVFLYNLTHFVHWPEESVSQGREDFDIGIAADPSFADVLRVILKSETKMGLPFRVSMLEDPDLAYYKYAVVYIDQNSMDVWEEVKDLFAGLPVLTVSDSSDFTSRGGMVSLIRDKNNIRIEVNYNLVTEAGLQMSSKLLSLAKIVGGR